MQRKSFLSKKIRNQRRGKKEKAGCFLRQRLLFQKFWLISVNGSNNSLILAKTPISRIVLINIEDPVYVSNDSMSYSIHPPVHLEDSVKTRPARTMRCLWPYPALCIWLEYGWSVEWILGIHVLAKGTAVCKFHLRRNIARVVLTLYDKFFLGWMISILIQVWHGNCIFYAPKTH